MKNTVYIETYGCSANQNNSEILAGLLTQAGYIVTNNQELADIIILNTCIVKARTESKIKRRIQDLKQFSKHHLLIISGCMPDTDAKKILNINPNAIFLGTHHFKEIVKLIRDFQENKLDLEKQNIYLEEHHEIKLNIPKIPQNKLISINQISEGCLGNCTYCKTRLAKGKLNSYPKDLILKSIENDLKQGAKEIWITSQDNAAYGMDKNKKQLPDLLKSILKLKHRFKLRLGMMDPNNVLPILNELIEIYKDKKIYKFLHIPIQSASNQVLKHMNRLYTIEQVEKIIKEFRKAIPEIVISTDIIVAYPTETKEDHKKNAGFLERYKPSILNLSRFSSHKQTPAGKLKEIPTSIAKKRMKELMQLHRQTAKENKKRYMEKTIDVFINKKIGSSLHQARDENYNLVLIKCDKNMLGKQVKIKIKDIGVHHMIGEVM